MLKNPDLYKMISDDVEAKWLGCCLDCRGFACDSELWPMVSLNVFFVDNKLFFTKGKKAIMHWYAKEPFSLYSQEGKLIVFVMKSLCSIAFTHMAHRARLTFLISKLLHKICSNESRRVAMS